MWVARWLGRMDEHCNLNLPGLEDLFAMQDVTELTSRLDETVEECTPLGAAGRRDGMDEHCNLNLPGLEDLFAMQDVTELPSRLDETVEEWRRDAVTEGQRVVLARQARLRCVGPPNIDIADPDALFAVIDGR